MADKAWFHSDGHHLDFTPDTDVEAGEIHQIAGMAGIANEDIPAGTKGALCIRGTIKCINSANALSDGETVGWDQATGRAVAAGTGDFDIGTSVGAYAATAGLEIVVLLNGNPIPVA